MCASCVGNREYRARSNTPSALSYEIVCDALYHDVFLICVTSVPILLNHAHMQRKVAGEVGDCVARM